MVTVIVGLAQSNSPKRQREYDTCLERNIDNPSVDRIILIEEEPGNRKPDRWLVNRKVSVESLGRRANYSDCIRIANELAGVVVICNADVHFDWSVKKLSALPEKTLGTITRTDFFRNLWSSDAWAFRPRMELSGCDWNLGRLGCETAFEEQVQKQLKWSIWNLCFEVCLVHIHGSRVFSKNHDDQIEYGRAPYPQPVRMDVGIGKFVPIEMKLLDTKTKTFRDSHTG